MVYGSAPRTAVLVMRALLHNLTAPLPFLHRAARRGRLDDMKLALRRSASDASAREGAQQRQLEEAWAALANERRETARLAQRLAILEGRGLESVVRCVPLPPSCPLSPLYFLLPFVHLLPRLP